ncbi:hypothetical protein SYJ56_19150 [Algoriphagus sp. D3-2-R+10]|uniref:hypothetical protein n=1 Tax=Algoriphagus aurantiacus TaxID=3103948 RepID=UPI002B3EBC29|nr:hypothetical protein [Algoriphagus sp. D3-2-R+10]MEB2777440.1 hypothetical protein [Algoriphagus sp. D3-2-R+10]
MQKFQDWFTQQWVILWGKRIDPKQVPWLMGPFGKLGTIGDGFVNHLAEAEGLSIERNSSAQGLISSMHKLDLPEEESLRLSQMVIDFYENTALYALKFSAKWNPLFRLFGKLVNYLFSNRIGQLNIPTNSSQGSQQICSEIITLSDPMSNEVKYTVWYRTFIPTGQVLYSGVYSTCKLPSGKTCIKAVFPLPNGNATVVMSPSVGAGGELRLISSGKKFGDPGFYFLLNDSKGDFWSQYISSFCDELTVYCHEGSLFAKQTLTLWHLRVVQFKYEIHRKL